MSIWSERPGAPGGRAGSRAQLPHPNGPTMDAQAPPCPVAFCGSHLLLDASPSYQDLLHGRLLPLAGASAQGPQPFPWDTQQMRTDLRD